MVQQEKNFLIYNFSTKEIPKEINSNGTIIAIEKHPTEALIAVLSKTTIKTHPYPTTLTIYEIPTGKEITKISPQAHLCTPILFNPLNKSLIINTWDNILHKYNYQDKAFTPLTMTPKTEIPYDAKLIVTRNPIKEEYIMCFDFKQMYSMQYKMEYVFSIKKLISCDNLLPQHKHTFSWVYNTHGSYAAFINKKECSTLHLESKKITPLITLNRNNNEIILSAIFNPINPIILAIVSSKVTDKKHILVHYINTLTGKNSTPINEQLEKGKVYLGCPNLKDMHVVDFSHDGTKLFIAVHTLCIVLDTPEMFLNNFYQPDTKDKCVLINWFLAEYFKQHDSLLPYDFRYLLINSILKVSEA